MKLPPAHAFLGKVCLSLLGTWEGGKGEGWNPAASTALQVLLSIQSLILVPDPFFNEPGFEQRHSGAEGKIQSREYNKKITEGTLRYAMIDLLLVCVYGGMGFSPWSGRGAHSCGGDQIDLLLVVGLDQWYVAPRGVVAVLLSERGPFPALASCLILNPTCAAPPAGARGRHPVPLPPEAAVHPRHDPGLD